MKKTKYQFKQYDFDHWYNDFNDYLIDYLTKDEINILSSKARCLDLLKHLESLYVVLLCILVLSALVLIWTIIAPIVLGFLAVVMYHMHKQYYKEHSELYKEMIMLRSELEDIAEKRLEKEEK